MFNSQFSTLNSKPPLEGRTGGVFYYTFRNTFCLYIKYMKSQRASM